MSQRQAKLVLLCEDGQHEAFLRRFFERDGWHPRAMRVLKSPAGRGAGEQWVRTRFPAELATLRKSHVAAVLIAMVDADRSTVEDRLAAFDTACRDQGVRPRQPTDPVALFVPRRNVETWIAYLSGEAVSEQTTYPRLDRERDCAQAVLTLKTMCDQRSLRSPAPPSVEAACGEYRSRILKR